MLGGARLLGPGRRDVRVEHRVLRRGLGEGLDVGEAPSGRRVRSASAVGKLRVSRDGTHSANSSTVLSSIAARVGK